MPEHKILKVSEPREWTYNGNTNVDYWLQLEGVDKQVQLTQKPQTPAPVVGQTLDLTLETHPKLDGKLKAKKAQQFQGRGGGPRPEDPKKAAHIARMHAQGVAVEHARVLATIGRLPEDFNLAQLKQIIEWFEKDARAARDAA